MPGQPIGRVANRHFEVEIGPRRKPTSGLETIGDGLPQAGRERWIDEHDVERGLRGRLHAGENLECIRAF